MPPASPPSSSHIANRHGPQSSGSSNLLSISFSTGGRDLHASKLASFHSGIGIRKRTPSTSSSSTPSDDPYADVPPIVVSHKMGRRKNTTLSSKLRIPLLFGFTILSTIFLLSRYYLDPGRILQGPKIHFNSPPLPQANQNSQTTLQGHPITHWNGSLTDLSTEEGEFVYPIRPLDAYFPLIPSLNPLTELTAKACLFPPMTNLPGPLASIWGNMFGGSDGQGGLCTPQSTKKEDAVKGKWVRVERDVGKRSGMYYIYLYYRRLQHIPPPSSSLAIRPKVINQLLLLTPAEALEASNKLLLESGRAKGTESGGQQDGEEWIKIDLNLRTGTSPKRDPIYLYYHMTPLPASYPSLPSGSASTPLSEPITELDLIFGTGPPLYGFERAAEGRGIMQDEDGKEDDGGKKGGQLPKIGLVERRRYKPLPKIAPLEFSTTGTFTILQIADLHFSVLPTVCRDTSPSHTACSHLSDTTLKSGGSDDITLSYLSQLLDNPSLLGLEKKPDLVIFTGDQLNGQDSSWDSESVIARVAKVVGDRGIRWASIFGNHDDERTDLARLGQMQVMTQQPYYVGSAGPREVDGVGNYVLKLRSSDPTHTHLFTLYFLDSHAYARSLYPFSFGYDWLKASQIEWFRSESSKISHILRPWKPAQLVDDTFNLGGSGEKRMGGRRKKRQVLDGNGVKGDGGKRLAKPNAMAFFHIPLPESFEVQPDKDPKTGKSLVWGQRLEGPGSPTHNSGFFEKGLLQQTEATKPDVGPSIFDDEDDSVDGDGEGGSVPEVKVVVNGHDHISEDCRRIKGVYMCFGGGSSYSGYSQPGFDKRVRVFQLSDFGETIRTWKVLDPMVAGEGEKLDDVVLYGTGQAGSVVGDRRS